MRRYLFCAGMDYFHPTSREYPTYADRRAAQLAKAAPRGEALRFDIFDMARGTRTIRRVAWSNGKPRESREELKVARPVDVARDMVKGQTTPHGVMHVLKDGRFDLMSITQVYEAGIGIGTDEPGTLHEFSIFSHSYENGPILLNSNDDRLLAVPPRGATAAQARALKIRGLMRDPDDKDCRAQYDFAAPTMDEAELAAFHQAFAKAGRCWVWGCTFEYEANTLLSVFRRALGDRKDFAKDPTIVVKLRTSEEVEGVLAFNTWLRLDPAVLRRKLQFNIGYSALKQLMWRKLTSTYPYAAAVGLRVPVIGAAYGTFAEPEGTQGLMRVSGKTSANVTFYKQHFGMKIDPERRNYFVFTHDMKPQ
ncbi:hypothetical protein [Acidovorax sp.]|uniref:hypothetical protein n=1 Tax=Acidovorax sp. TaxID=1872122 RepID=UPI002627BE18|nr:hypothetical protein [Acidovorax sp.]